MSIVGPAPAKLETDLNGLPDRDDEDEEAGEDVNEMPQVPVALQVALRGQENEPKRHPGEEHPDAVSFVDRHSPLIEKLAPSVVDLAV